MGTMLVWLAVGVLPISAGDVTIPHDTVKAKKGPTQLKFEVVPESVVIHIDGRKKGKAKHGRTIKVKPGTRLIRLVHNKDEVEFEIQVNRGETTVVKYAFEDSGAPAPTPPPDKPKKKDPPKKAPQPEPEPDPEPSPDDEPFEGFDSDIPR